MVEEITRGVVVSGLKVKRTLSSLMGCGPTAAITTSPERLTPGAKESVRPVTSAFLTSIAL